jgi:hypothetical protein
MAPHWFDLVARAALGLGFAPALVIAADIFLLGNRQHVAIMNLVFPLTALYMGRLRSGCTWRVDGGCPTSRCRRTR